MIAKSSRFAAVGIALTLCGLACSHVTTQPKSEPAPVAAAGTSSAAAQVDAARLVGADRIWRLDELWPHVQRAAL